MNSFDIFRSRLASMNEMIKDKDSEYVRIEVLGLDVRHIRKYTTDDHAIEMVGFDENGAETVLICPLGHFSAKLAISKKHTKREPLGFRINPDVGGEKIL